eukprot:12388500-Alexandrium_andersonii.AAC.1
MHPEPRKTTRPACGTVGQAAGTRHQDGARVHGCSAVSQMEGGPTYAPPLRPPRRGDGGDGLALGGTLHQG